MANVGRAPTIGTNTMYWPDEKFQFNLSNCVFFSPLKSATDYTKRETPDFRSLFIYLLIFFFYCRSKRHETRNTLFVRYENKKPFSGRWLWSIFVLIFFRSQSHTHNGEWGRRSGLVGQDVINFFLKYDFPLPPTPRFFHLFQNTLLQCARAPEHLSLETAVENGKSNCGETIKMITMGVIDNCVDIRGMFEEKRWSKGWSI